MKNRILFCLFLCLPAHADDGTDCSFVAPFHNGYEARTERSGISLWKIDGKTKKKVFQISKSMCGLFEDIKMVDINRDKQDDLLLAYEREDMGALTIWIQKEPFQKIFEYDSYDIPTLLDFDSTTYLIHEQNPGAADEPNLLTACEPSTAFYQDLIEGSKKMAGRFRHLDLVSSDSKTEGEKWVYRMKLAQQSVKLLRLDQNNRFVPETSPTNRFFKWRKELLEKHFGKTTKKSCRSLIQNLSSNSSK